MAAGKGLPGWDVRHVNELGFQGKSDELLFLWALENKAIIFTYDEDFADSRFYPLGSVHSSEKETEYVFHKERQPGEGFWALAPGAGDASEGMVWVSKKSS